MTDRAIHVIRTPGGRSPEATAAPCHVDQDSMLDARTETAPPRRRLNPGRSDDHR